MSLSSPLTHGFSIMKTYTFAQPEIQTYYNNTGVNARSIMSGREWPDKHELTHNYEIVETVMALEHAFAPCRSTHTADAELIAAAFRMGLAASIWASARSDTCFEFWMVGFHPVMGLALPNLESIFA